MIARIARRTPPEPWVGECRLPWHEPAFSARMLREHLSQAHDRASRRFATIERHVAWLHDEVLGGRPGRVLDLGCGPGLYTSRLARLGHGCVGIDVAPAALAHARAEAEREGLACEYRLADVRTVALGSDFDAVLLLSGELNTFSPTDAAAVLRSAHNACSPRGQLVLELHPFEFVQRRGHAPPVWFAAEQSVFSDAPHLWLRESFWNDSTLTAIERYFVLEERSTDASEYVTTTQAWDDGELGELLRAASFATPRRFASLGGAESPDLSALVARAATTE